jgi:hypothetical protein
VEFEHPTDLLSQVERAIKNTGSSGSRVGRR